MGVSALSVTLIRAILKKWPSARITLLVSGECQDSYELMIEGEEKQIPIINNRFLFEESLRKNVFWILSLAWLQKVVPSKQLKKRIIFSNEFLKALYEADLVCDIFSGDSFSDIYGVRRFLRLSLSRIVALVLGIQLVMLPQTYGPYKSRIAQMVARLIVKHSKLIYARDLEGDACIKNLLGDTGIKKRVRYCPDLAFSLEPELPSHQNIQPPIEEVPDASLIGINVSGLLYGVGCLENYDFQIKGDYRTLVHNLADRFLQETTAHILLVPHTFSLSEVGDCDPPACREVFSFIHDIYPGRVHIIDEEYNQNEIKALIGTCSFFVGSRMHACIAAMSQGIPTVGVAYSDKFQGVFDIMGVGDMVLDARKFDEETISENVMMHYRNNGNAKKILDEKIGPVRTQISETMEFILSSI